MYIDLITYIMHNLQPQHYCDGINWGQLEFCLYPLAGLFSFSQAVLEDCTQAVINFTITRGIVKACVYII